MPPPTKRSKSASAASVLWATDNPTPTPAAVKALIEELGHEAVIEHPDPVSSLALARKCCANSMTVQAIHMTLLGLGIAFDQKARKTSLVHAAAPQCWALNFIREGLFQHRPSVLLHRPNGRAARAKLTTAPQWCCFNTGHPPHRSSLLQHALRTLIGNRMKRFYRYTKVGTGGIPVPHTSHSLVGGVAALLSR